MSIFLKANWENIIMANYAVPIETLKPFIPRGVELDLYNGKAYISLVGFMFKNTKLFQVPIPWLGAFEEINLRFYVIRKEETKLKRGVVFINETIPYKAVAWVANKLYKEHYTAIATKHRWNIGKEIKFIEYRWNVNSHWNSLSVEASTAGELMSNGSFEEFILEHYFGYTKIDDRTTEEYQIRHPRWKVNKVINYRIYCDFAKMYGNEFGFLNTTEPDSVLLAEGSSVEVDWKRNRISSNL
jgi:uncharacterized protein